ncbi:MAG: hypothetical protein M1829_005675 [Trizodia sp. TS-e1964]|nr:MAG: hypothetical protein M1829_005675 [Trizodia sp. TS-e1964]
MSGFSILFTLGPPLVQVGDHHSSSSSVRSQFPDSLCDTQIESVFLPPPPSPLALPLLSFLLRSALPQSHRRFNIPALSKQWEMSSGQGGMASQYQVLEELGSGSFGIVYKAIELKTGDIVAIKHIDLESSEDDIQEIQQEISVLSTCASPYVTQYKTSFLRGHKLWIVMEYLGGGSCLDLLKPGPFHEAHIAIVCRELLLGLDYLHREGKIHRDIKAANILLSTTGKVKLADFGVAAQLTNIKSQRNTFVGTPFWMAPEVIQQSGYDFKADIWSLGILAMELVNGEPPNASTHPMKVLFLIPKAPPPRLEGSNYSRNFREFVAACLVKDPDRRPTANELLQHKFIRSAGKVEALQELVERSQQWDGGKARPAHPKFYEETLNAMTPREEKDQWIFDTVKAPTIAPKHTQKRRKLSILPSIEQEPPATGLQRLNLEEGPLQFSSPPPKTSRQSIGRRKSSGVRVASSGRKVSGQKKPLGPDMSFGNGGSTVRLFRRVSGESPSHYSEEPASNHDENKPPMVETVTKEAVLGRRAFAKVVDQAFQETYAQTGSHSKREAISKVADAWSALDSVDPEGEYHLLKLIIEKAQSDPKLAALLQPCGPVTPSKPKLVLAQNNPHLKSHRRRQSLQVSDDGWNIKPSNLPGSYVPGMEHTKQLADVLYGRWIEGMKNRWPAS